MENEREVLFHKELFYIFFQFGGLEVAMKPGLYYRYYKNLRTCED